MERCDFSIVVTTMRRYISDDYNLNQCDFLDSLFCSFFFANEEEEEPKIFDFGLMCRWINGQKRISPAISSFYMKEKNQEKLAKDIVKNIIPLMYDSAMAVQEIHRIFIQDSTISEKKKMDILMKCYPFKTEQEEAIFLAQVLCFTMQREFHPRSKANQLQMENLSPIVKEFILNGSVPNPCPYFGGREDELVMLHERLSQERKLFLHGIAGIGKSELVKMYAKRYRKEYTNIVYLMYTGDLRQDIINLDFADDLPIDNEEERFKKHNRFLRTLKEDTLLIIDNFNTTATAEPLLEVVLKYRCSVLFATRSVLEEYPTMELKEIAAKQALLELIGYFYSKTKKYKNVLESIIDVVHSHTFAVELVARVLDNGLLRPIALLHKLKSEKVGFRGTDEIRTNKDGKREKKTYYNHIRFLFSLYELSDCELDIMRNLTVVPTQGIYTKIFAKWLSLKNLNTVNDLVEYGLVQRKGRNMILLHPMILEVAIEETKPSVQKCSTLLYNIRKMGLCCGEDIPYYRQLFQTIDNIIYILENDNADFYVRFLEDIYPYLQKFDYEHGMDLILRKLELLLSDYSVGTDKDRAILLDYKALYEKSLEKAIILEKRALQVILEVNEENAHLVSNIHSNLGLFYEKSGQYELAMKHMKKGIQLLETYNNKYYHDRFVKIANYAVLLAEMKKSEESIEILKRLEKFADRYEIDYTLDYALLQESIGNVYLTKGKLAEAKVHLKKTMDIFEKVFEADPEVLEQKKNEIMMMYKNAGVFLRHQLENKNIRWEDIG